MSTEHLKTGEAIQERYRHLTQEGCERLGYPHAKALWTITTGRSGTLWLAKLLMQLGGFVAEHEPHPTLFYEGRLHMEGKCIGEDCVRLMRAMRGTLVRTAYYKHWCYTECSHLLSHQAECLLRAFPDSRFLHLSRDPRAFVQSALPRGWMSFDRANSHWWTREVPYDRPWERLVWLWNEVHSKGLELEQKYPDRVMRLRCEDMWTDPERISKLLEFVGHNQPRFAMGAIYEALERRVNESKRRPARWKKTRNAFLDEVAGETMRELGYD